MNKSSQGISGYTSFILVGLSVVTALLVILAVLSFTSSDRSVADPLTAQTASMLFWPAAAQTLPPSAPPITSTLATNWPDLPQAVELAAATSQQCAAFSFEGALNIQDGRLSFGRFNLVSGVFPSRQDDPLASWKLLQFESLPIKAAIGQGTAVHTTLPVDQAVNLLLTDPFTQVPLLSARWQVKEIAVLGRSAGINAMLEPNLSDIRINNAINSLTLSNFQDTTGILTMHITQDKSGTLAVDPTAAVNPAADIAAQVQAGIPVYATMHGIIYAASCFK